MFSPKGRALTNAERALHFRVNQHTDMMGKGPLGRFVSLAIAVLPRYGCSFNSETQLSAGPWMAAESLRFGL